MTAYNETCAAVGNDYWNQRMFLLHGDAKYVDLFERTLYNGLISGVSLDGKTYFYPNPLESNGQHTRSAWFGVACCPGNITRFMPSVPGYVYAEQNDTLFVNLFMSNSANVRLGNGEKLKVTQATKYPWSGAVHIAIDPDGAGAFALKIRVPGWARNQAMPSDLYSFQDKDEAAPKLRVNGKDTPLALDSGYATIRRAWRRGDTVDLELPMPVRRIRANAKVTADQQRIALQRGPVVYAAEWVDSPDKRVRNILLRDGEPLRAEWKPNLLRGVEVIQGKVTAFRYDSSHHLLRTNETFTAIPYYAWANRGAGQMEVWIANGEQAVHPTAYPSLASMSKVLTSGQTVAENGVRDPRMVADQEDPASSADESSYFSWAPKRGTQEWIEYDFPKTESVSSVEVYWVRQPRNRSVQLPKGWRLLFKDGTTWRPVDATEEYGIAPDRYNRVRFKPVSTTAIRLEVQAQPDKSAGISEWKVN